jgi:predicted metal-dependent peptidase
MGILDKVRAFNRARIDDDSADVICTDPRLANLPADFTTVSDDQKVVDLASRGHATDVDNVDSFSYKHYTASNDRISNIIAYMVYNQAYSFWGYLLSSFVIKISPDVPTACLSYTAGSLTPDIIMGQQLLETCNDKQVAFVLIHEILHFVNLHPWRCKGRDAEFFNYAADRIINTEILSTLVNEEITGKQLSNKVAYAGVRAETLPGILYLEGDRTSNTSDTETQYELERKKAQDQQKNGGGSNPFSGSGQPGAGAYDPGGELVDQHDWEPVTNNVSEEQAKEMIKRMVDSAGKLAGNTPGYITNLISGFKPAKLRWSNLVVSWVERTVGGDNRRNTWCRMNPIHPDLFPGREAVPDPRIDIGFDVSGSMGDEDFKECVSEVIAISHFCNVKAVQIDTEIKQETYMDFDGDIVKSQGISRSGYGGTDMNPVLDFFAQQETPADICIVFTDGYIPEIDPKLIFTNTLFVVTSNGSTEFANGRTDFDVIKIGGGRDM